MLLNLVNSVNDTCSNIAKRNNTIAKIVINLMHSITINHYALSIGPKGLKNLKQNKIFRNNKKTKNSVRKSNTSNLVSYY